MKPYYPASQLIINEDGSIFHLHIRPEHLADKVILVGDQNRVDIVASYFDKGSIECDNPEFQVNFPKDTSFRIIDIQDMKNGGIKIIMEEI